MSHDHRVTCLGKRRPDRLFLGTGADDKLQFVYHLHVTSFVVRGPRSFREVEQAMFARDRNPL
jgi:hypothetical protein